jgi:Rha family phage regulatory protein
MSATFPAICDEMHVFERDGVALVNSRDVAAVFGKRHDHILRDIDALDISPELGRSWFRPTQALDSYGREQPACDLTRDGFSLLVMGFTGAKALRFKVRYIEAFNAMEAALQRGTLPISQMLREAVAEAVAPFGVQLNRMERKQDDLALKLTSKRKSLTAQEERILDRYALSSGRLCGCCRRRFVVEPDGSRLPTAATDHAYTNQLAHVTAKSVTCWLICSSPNGEPRTNEYCHDKLTSGEMPREMAAHRFNAYADFVREFIASEYGPPLIAPVAQPSLPPPQENLPLLVMPATRAERICSAIYFTLDNTATIAEIGACGIATDGKDGLASVRNGILRQLDGSTEHTKPPWNAKPTLFQLADPTMKGRSGVRYSCTGIGIETAKRVVERLAD